MHSWTVAKVINDTGNDYVTVVFLESARFYRLKRANPGFAGYLARLQQAEKGAAQVKVQLTEPNGQLIDSVQ